MKYMPIKRFCVGRIYLILFLIGSSGFSREVLRGAADSQQAFGAGVLKPVTLQCVEILMNMLT